MSESNFAVPLAFDHHVARMLVTHLRNGRWSVRTEVDGRVLGSEVFMLRVQVDCFRTRMQEWLTQAETEERRLASAA